MGGEAGLTPHHGSTDRASGQRGEDGQENSGLYQAAGARGLRHSLAAHRAGLDKVIIPKRNEADLDDLPEDVRAKLTFVLAETVDDVFPNVLPALNLGAKPNKRKAKAKPVSVAPAPSRNGHEEEPVPVEAESLVGLLGSEQR